jgi:hypothetical protein
MSNNKTSKNLLNESQIRQFMKLASLEPLTPGFVAGLEERRESRPPGHSAHTSHGRSDKPIPGTDLMAEEEADAEALEDYAAGDEERGHDEEAEHDELEAADEEVGGEERTVRVDDFLAALERALEDAMGEEVEVDASALEDEDAAEDAADDLEVDADVDLDVEDDLALQEDKAYTSKKEEPGADKRKGAEKRGAEATKLKHDEPGGRGHKKGDDAYVNEEQGADDREDEHLGAEDGKEADKKQSFKDRRKEMRGARRAAGEAGDPVPHQESVAATDELVEQITKRVAARILKTALKK